MARTIISLAQRTPLRGSGGYSDTAFSARGDRREFPQAEQEAARFEEFFACFEEHDLYAEMLERVVLDFGNGYGGRTVQYARLCGPRYVWGVEPFENLVSKSAAFAEASGATNCEFRQCTQHAVPLDDDSIDVVVSYDVLEHVADPRVSLTELRRVLKPGGKAFLVFPVYHGATSHHLDYIARVPGLHWFFRAETLISAVNDLLSRNDLGRWGTALQPPPGLSFDGGRRVLPTLNGLTGDQFLRIARGFEFESIRFNPLFPRHKWPRRLAGAMLGLGPRGRLRDALTGQVSAVLRKPTRDSRPTLCS